MPERFLRAPDALGALVFFVLLITTLGCEVSRVPVLQPDGGDNAGGANGGMQGSPGGGFGTPGGGSNPCNAFHGGCSPLVECTNDDGEAVCGECPEGTTGDGTECTDIDECEEGLDDCDDDPEATCVNIDFSFACRCPSGTRDLETDGRNCVSIDNPMGGSGGMNGTGGTAGGPGIINECVLGLDDCDDDPAATCTDTITSYSCTCPDGYEDTVTGARNCVDINECDEGIDACDTSPAATCENTDGSYTCDCPDGYMVAANGHDCEDFDDCSVANDCDDDPDACVDGVGDYSCECPDGYTGNGVGESGCTNINECLAGTDNCDPTAMCDDTDGSYTCTCPGGDPDDVLGDGSACTSPETRVAMGNSHTCVLDRGGLVKCWGQGFNGQLGLGNTRSSGFSAGQTGEFFSAVDLGGRAVAIAGGCGHSCALLENGDVKCWGLNNRGQLGQGDTETRGDGPDEMGTMLDPVPLDMPAVAITAGCEYSCAMLENDSVICWGTNEYGQLGTGVAPGAPASATFNSGDQSGEVEALDPIDLGGTAKRIRGGFRFVCAQMSDDSLKCWGRNNNGQLGKNDVNHRGDAPGEMGSSLTAINLGTGRTVRDFAPGYIHVCARLDNDQVKCWGSGGFTDITQEGAPCPREPTPSNPDPLPTYRVFGSIGYGDGHDPSEQCTDMGINRGDMFEQRDERDAMNNEMGDTLPVVPLVSPPASMTAGHHTCMAFGDGSVSCFGFNTTGQLGLGNLESIGDDPGEMGPALPEVSLGLASDAIAVFTGQEDSLSYSRSCALFETGELKCWGSNNIGSLGIGDQLTRGDDPNEMGTNLPVSFDLW